MQPFRVTPAGQPRDYVTFGFNMPKSTHQRKIPCGQVDTLCTQVNPDGVPTCFERHCTPHAHGWCTEVDVATKLGMDQASYIHAKSGRVYALGDDDGTTIMRFYFGEGQQCFREHFVNLDRDPQYFRKAGDWRTGGRLHVIEGSRWLDDFQQSTEAVRKNIEKG